MVVFNWVGGFFFFSGHGNRKDKFNRKGAGKKDVTENTHFVLHAMN